MQSELTLAELADASGLQPRTIRSWVAQGLIPGPLSRGPAARYPADQLERILAIRTMKDRLGMSLTDIRHELLVATADQIQAWADQAEGIAPEAPASPAMESPVDPGEAVDYFKALRAKPAAGAVHEVGAARMARSAPAKRSVSGFEALERRLSDGGTRTPSERRGRAEEWIRIPVTPDVELSVRGRLDAEQRARLERCAELMRDILIGRE